MALVSKSVLTLADALAKGAAQTAYQTPMGQTVKDYNWGSNANAANQGIAFVQAYQLSGNKECLRHGLLVYDELWCQNALTGWSKLMASRSRCRASWWDAYPEGHPMVAQPALQQGQLLGQNLARLLAKQPLRPFAYDDKGSMATIGRNHAVADIRLFGRDLHLAWLAWRFVHVLALVSFRNRLMVVLNWTWTYISYDKGLRYIIGRTKVPMKAEPGQDKAMM